MEFIILSVTVAALVGIYALGRSHGMDKGHTEGYTEGRNNLMKSAITGSNGVVVIYPSEFKEYYLHMRVVDKDETFTTSNGWGSRIDMKPTIKE